MKKIIAGIITILAICLTIYIIFKINLFPIILALIGIKQ